jgi:uncharacterized membrane protein
MTLAPLLHASPVIQIHAFATFAAMGLGGVQLALPKGSPRHRAFGYVWVGLMVLIAFSSLFIHTIRLWGPFSAIHLLSLWVLIIMPLAAWRASTGRMPGHRRIMQSTYVFALIVTGFFTLYPGRIMYQVFFGP